VQEFDAGDLLEQLGRKMRQPAGAARRIAGGCDRPRASVTSSSIDATCRSGWATSTIPET
jgi:hypothetical protein